jgi:hypothetical protein
MSFKNFAFAVVTAFVMSGCASSNAPTMTPLEIQSLQSKEYEAKKELVFPSVVSVFQDLGYTIANADVASGLISAESTTQSSVGYQILTGSSLTKQTRATGFVEQIGSKTKVRLNFVVVSQTSSGYGQSNRRDEPILDAKVYESAFEKIDSAIFLRKNSQ